MSLLLLLSLPISRSLSLGGGRAQHKFPHYYCEDNLSSQDLQELCWYFAFLHMEYSVSAFACCSLCHCLLRGLTLSRKCMASLFGQCLSYSASDHRTRFWRGDLLLLEKEKASPCHHLRWAHVVWMTDILDGGWSWWGSNRRSGLAVYLCRPFWALDWPDCFGAIWEKAGRVGTSRAHEVCVCVWCRGVRRLHAYAPSLPCLRVTERPMPSPNLLSSNVAVMSASCASVSGACQLPFHGTRQLYRIRLRHNGRPVVFRVAAFLCQTGCFFRF
jgi:hypothetical protein